MQNVFLLVQQAAQTAGVVGDGLEDLAHVVWFGFAAVFIIVLFLALGRRT